jgi:hypothetical protein
MTAKDNTTRNIVLILMIVVAASFRLIAFEYKDLSNFNPVGAIAIFGGAYFASKWKGYLTVLLTLFTTDIVLNYLYTSKFSIGYDGIIGVYLSFALMVFLGSMIKKVNVLNVVLASLASVLIHWLVTDLPWFYTTLNLYPHTLAGYGTSLVNAIPFEYNMIYGNLVFGLLLFGGFELAKSKYAFLQTKKQLAL